MYLPVLNLYSRSRRTGSERRHGNVVVLMAFMLSFLLILVAFGVDIGYLLVARTELQRTADSAAMAGGWAMLNEARYQGPESLAAVQASARLSASQFAALNRVCNAELELDLNAENAPQGEIVFGRYNASSGLSTLGKADAYNAVHVRVHRNSERNGEVPFFFARVLGMHSASMSAEATATFRDGIIGFRATSETGNASLLPFGLDIETWNAMIAGEGGDSWAFDSETETLSPGADGRAEVKLFPEKTGGPSGITEGNFGTLDIGASDNSSAALMRQIRDGVSPADMAHHGGELSLDPSSGTLSLNGDTGIDANLALALADIVGQSRTIPLYREVSGSGETATYTIVAFAGIRILDFNLNGADKYITIQSGLVVDDSAISDPGQANYQVYQPVILVR